MGVSWQAMARNPQDIAQELWDLMEAGEKDAIREPDAPLVAELRSSLNLPAMPEIFAPITIPGRRESASVQLGAEGDTYSVRRGSMVELPVKIETRKGVLFVDPDDPLARAQRSIEKIAAIKF